MTHGARQYTHLDELYRLYADRRNVIEKRLDDFAAVDRSEHFFELAYCLLTPQSSAVHAARAVESLRTAPMNLEDVAAILRDRGAYIRFHNTKARHILRAREQFPEIAEKLRDGIASPALREWLVQHVKGLGWKESSHFLRNIGHRNLAILDRHILKNLRYHSVIPLIPVALTPVQYRAIEQKFLAFADQIGISMDELDLAFWSRETGEILK
jgi:N-glycosylase/DNA lyase